VPEAFCSMCLQDCCGQGLKFSTREASPCKCCTKRASFLVLLVF